MRQSIRLLFSFRTILSILLIAFLYIVLNAYIINNSFAGQTLVSPFPLIYKLRIFSGLFVGMFTAFGLPEGVLQLLTALLVGLNITLLQKTIVKLHKKGRVRMSVGGLSVVGLMSGGCGTCGISLFSFFGVGSAFSSFSSFTSQLQIVTIILLAASTIYMLRQFAKADVCNI